MLAFIRGGQVSQDSSDLGGSFMGLGEIYVKLLPSGQPVQLTHDAKTKLGPSFSPDNSRIAYSLVEPWDTWQVAVLGGEPQMLLPNASSLTWIEGGKRLLFSEIKEGAHMVVVTTDEAEEIAATSTCPRANAAWPIIPTFRRMADGSLLLRWTVEPKFSPVGLFHSKARTRFELLALPTARVFRARGRLTVNGSISLPRRMTFISGGSAFRMESQSS
jgi:Tol biopolymer transport system component